MQVFTTTEELEINHISYLKRPLLVDDCEMPLSIVNHYQLRMIFKHGKTNSHATCRNHADALTGRNSTPLKDKPLHWDDQPHMTRSGKESSNLSLYQHWSQYYHQPAHGLQRYLKEQH
jgi:hypothetical protein